MIPIKVNADSLEFAVYVQPRSSKVCITGSHRKALKIKLTAPPVGGNANKQCIQLLAKTLKLPKSSVIITSGQTSRLKQIRIHPKKTDGILSELTEFKDRIANLAQKTS
jgi:uncharacterized protein (TIGR00251 family)